MLKKACYQKHYLHRFTDLRKKQKELELQKRTYEGHEKKETFP